MMFRRSAAKAPWSEALSHRHRVGDGKKKEWFG
jgi:hypothetical protein